MIKNKGGTSENLDEVLSEQDSKIAELQSILANKAGGTGTGWTADDICHFYFTGEYVGSCVLLRA